MRLDKPTMDEIDRAIETLTLAASWAAREDSNKNPRGLSGDSLENRSADVARAASMDMYNSIKNTLNKYSK